MFNKFLKLIHNIGTFVPKFIFFYDYFFTFIPLIQQYTR